jgi:hypothetical protein
LSLENAMKIEENSWDTTNELVEAFTDAEAKESKEILSSAPLCFDIPSTNEIFVDVGDGEQDNNEFKDALAKYKDWIVAIDNNDISALKKLSEKTGSMLEAVVDEINEISADFMGDIVIEETEDGKYAIIDCYREIII